MKRIAILGTAYPFRGGIAAFNEQLAKTYLSEGDHVKIFTFTSQYPDFLFPGKTQYSKEPSPDIEIDRVLNSVNPISWIVCVKRIINYKPDLLIVPFWIPFMAPSLGTVINRIKRNIGIPVISIVHNLLPHEKRIGDKTLSRYFFKNVDGAVSLSKSINKAVIDFTNAKSAYCPHPIYSHYGESVSKEEACSKLELDSTKKHLLFFGLIRKYKGVDMLIEALKIVNEKLSDVELVIAGEFYDDESKYNELINSLNLQSVIKIVSGFIPDSDLKNYFGMADLVVFPYREATQSGVTQVAYHFNKPMLVTKVGGLPDLVAENKAGLHCMPNSESIAEKIIYFFENNLSEKIIPTLVEEKKKFEWSAMVNTINNLYKELV